ncbi:unnamed protein product [Pleuronectes platessa]|uniref:Uncharacterized protein n=1 Tax=Pleuronectes platessa TaxID=8262 RepID=A0A9N7TWD3_PLEPL|nr:unnamed protein product [Pleuronectes platessa]
MVNPAEVLLQCSHLGSPGDLLTLYQGVRRRKSAENPEALTQTFTFTHATCGGSPEFDPGPELWPHHHGLRFVDRVSEVAVVDPIAAADDGSQLAAVDNDCRSQAGSAFITLDSSAALDIGAQKD